MENADQILVVAKQISENTNAWSNWGSIVMTVISLVASVVTIAGIVMFYYEYKKNKPVILIHHRLICRVSFRYYVFFGGRSQVQVFHFRMQ